MDTRATEPPRTRSEGAAFCTLTPALGRWRRQAVQSMTVYVAAVQVFTRIHVPSIDCRVSPRGYAGGRNLNLDRRK